MERREFLSRMSGLACTAGLLKGSAPARIAKLPSRDQLDRRLIIIVFGGGVRTSETIGKGGRRNIPRIWHEMVPRGTLFTNMRVEHKVVHPNSTGSIMTGHWEWGDLDWSKPVSHPTIFEIIRKTHNLPDTSAWAFVYASILSKITESSADGFGALYGANAVEPPVIPRAASEKMDSLMREAASSGSTLASRKAAETCAEFAKSESGISLAGIRSEEAKQFINGEFAEWKLRKGTTSHDAFITARAINCMKRFDPRILVIAFGEIDCAHYGSWSRYVEAIRRTDELTWRVWRASQELGSYRGKTLMVVLPDHGRELERADGSGFIHHSDFYTDTGADEGCRRVWMLLLGRDVTGNRKISEPFPITCAASTGLEYLNLPASPGAAKSLLSLSHM